MRTNKILGGPTLAFALLLILGCVQPIYIFLIGKYKHQRNRTGVYHPVEASYGLGRGPA